VVPVSAVAELPLDLDAFEGPFDLLLTLVLKEELELRDVEIVEIVLTFLAERGEDLEVDGEFLVLVASLLELKARGLFPRRKRCRSRTSTPTTRRRAGRAPRAVPPLPRGCGVARGEARVRLRSLFPPRPGSARTRARPPSRPQQPESLAAALRALAAEPPTPSLRHITLTFPPVSAVPRALPRGAPTPRPLRLRQGGRGAHTRIEQAVAFLALLELRKAGEIAIGQAAPFEEITVWNNAA
jgi:segregation and condensation protein A